MVLLLYTHIKNLAQDKKKHWAKSTEMQIILNWRRSTIPAPGPAQDTSRNSCALSKPNCACQEKGKTSSRTAITALLIHYSKGKHALIDVFPHDCLKVVNSADWVTRTNLLFTHQHHPQINLGLCLSSPVVPWVWPQICFAVAQF